MLRSKQFGLILFYAIVIKPCRIHQHSQNPVNEHKFKWHYIRRRTLILSLLAYNCIRMAYNSSHRFHAPIVMAQEQESIDKRRQKRFICNKKSVPLLLYIGTRTWNIFLIMNGIFFSPPLSQHGISIAFAKASNRMLFPCLSHTLEANAHTHTK